MYPLVVERKLSPRFGVAGVLETSRADHKTFNEYGPRFIVRDTYGQWFFGLMTSLSLKEEDGLAQHRRDYAVRFGRVVRLGSSQE
jgi:hypothetical protein